MQSKSLLQHHSSKASILQHSAFFTVQLSYPYMTTGKTIALTRRTFAGKVISLFLNMLSRLIITFLPRSKHLLISWLQSPSAVILESPKILYHKFYSKTCIYMVREKVKSLIHVQLFGTPWIVAHGIFQARVLEWVAISFSRGSSLPRDQTWVSHIAVRCFTRKPFF